MGKIGLIARREFNERVRKKSFIITTIITPLLMVGAMVLMVWLMGRTNNRDKEILVVDRSGIIAPSLSDEGTIHFRPSEQSLEEMQREQPEGVYGILVIDEDIMTDQRGANLYTYEASTVETEEAIAGQIKRIIESEKLKAYDIENLDRILAEIETPITLQTKTISTDGENCDCALTDNTSPASSFSFSCIAFLLEGACALISIEERQAESAKTI